ncbi:MAG: glycosyltransferase family 4 protein [Melioribacteraceae bacterium]|nr:glycosyltransferase family 4 protein [Melioribacteraceae bacterium]
MEIKVLQILDNLALGGAEVLTLDLCKAPNHPFELFLASFGGGVLLKDFQDTGRQLFLLKRRFPLDISLILKIRKIVKKNKINIIHSNRPVEALHAYFATRFMNVKNVLSMHGYYPNKKDDKVLDFLMPKLDAKIMVSEPFFERVKEETNFNFDNTFIVPNGVDFSKIEKKDSSLYTELKLKDNDVLLGMVGNFNSSGRDQITICKGFNELSKSHSQLHLCFVGDHYNKTSKYYLECYNYCKDNNLLEKVHFLGKRDDINNILSALDIFVYSSNHDSFGIAILEAMAMGIPTVINDIPPFKMISDNGKYCSLFKTKDKTDFITKVHELIVNKDLRSDLGENGKIHAISTFSIGSFIETLDEVYKKILLN